MHDLARYRPFVLLAALLAAAPAAAQETVAAPPVSTAAVESVWDFVVKGGVMMIPIGLCSLIGLTVVVERLLTLRRARVIPVAFLPGLRDRAKDGGTAGRLEYCRANDSPVARVFAAGIKRLGGPLEVVERHIEEAGSREVLKLRRRLRVLSVIAAVAPLLGLLGTIFGMIRAFQTVATSADALGKTEMLAGGIYEAMITTAAGLVVAIPALICYHWLSSKVQRLVMEIDEMTVDFVEDVAIGSGPAAAAPAIDARAPAGANGAPDERPAAVDLGVAAT